VGYLWSAVFAFAFENLAKKTNLTKAKPDEANARRIAI
jgi:hypothetical protein